jgi:thioesterase domain-containing protein
LRTDDFGPLDNFFDAGGNSLLAMSLLVEVQLQTGLTVAPDQIFHAFTMRELCRALVQKNRQNADDLRQIGPVAVRHVRSGTSPWTLYFAHAFTPGALLEGLAPELSIAAIAISDAEWLRHAMSGTDRAAAIERVSEAYAQAIAASRKSELCCLAGESFGGVLAIETARKLEERGVAVEFVFLFDTYLHRALHRMIYNGMHNGLLTRKFQEQGGYLQLARGAWSRLKKILFRAPTSARVAVSSKPRAQARPDLGALLSRLRDHGSEAYRGPSRPLKAFTVLFRATRTLHGRPMKLDPDIGWARPLAAKLAMVPAPGHHFDMLQGDHANYVAHEINKRISGSQHSEPAFETPVGNRM